MKKIFAVCASVIAAAAMSVCAFAEAPTGDLLISPAPGTDVSAVTDPSDVVKPDDGTSTDTENSGSNAQTGAEGIAFGAAVLLAGAAIAVSAKRK